MLLAWLPAASAVAANRSQSTTGVDGREALKAAAALVQQGKLVEADSQAQRALADPETRAVAYSILGTMRQLAHAKTLREEDEASSRLQLRLMDPDR